MEMIVVAVVALVLGIVIGILYARGPRQRYAAEADALRMRLKDEKED